MSYHVLIDRIEQDQWLEYASNFADYSIYQTWPYQEVRADTDGQEVSRIVVKDENNEIVMMSHVRIKHVKPLGLRVGYMQWGPLIFKKDGTCSCSAEVLKILRQAYLGTRVNVLRVIPNIVNNSANQRYIDMFRAGGFHQRQNVRPYHTMVLRLNRSEDTLQKGLHRSWRRNLRKAEAAGVEVRERTDEGPFEILEGYYSYLVRRKGFRGLSPQVFARTQSTLSDSDKMRLIVAYCDGEPIAVHLISTLGDAGLSLLVASDEKAYACGASYSVWWKSITVSRNRRMKKYDVGGISFSDNPGVARFKAGMGGEEQFHIGAFDAYTNSVARNAFRIGERVYRLLKR